MSDELPGWASYTNDKVDNLRTELNARIDDKGKEIADERADRVAGDKELADEIAEMSARRMATWSARVWALVIAGVMLLGGGVVTLAVFFIEALSHLNGGTP